MNGRLPLYLLLAGGALFAALLFREATAPEEAGSGPMGPAPRPVALASARLRPAGNNVAAMLTAILARPLFSPTRRPSGKSDDAGAAAGLGDSRLTGIVTVPHRRIAIFAVANGRPLVVGEGDNVQGWRIDSITPEEVSLTGPDGSKTLQPKSDPNLAVQLRRTVPAMVPARTLMPQLPRPLGPVPPIMRPGVPAFRAPGQR
jgi:hypothetical protein